MFQKGDTGNLTEHLQHSTGHQDTELFSDIRQNLDGTGQATGEAQQAIPDGDLLTIANCGLPVV